MILYPPLSARHEAHQRASEDYLGLSSIEIVQCVADSVDHECEVGMEWK
jgi:hypothetical protein